MPALTRWVDADLPVSPRVVSGMRARDDEPLLSRARDAAAFVVRRLALFWVDGPVSSLAVPMSAVWAPRPALAPRPPPIDALRFCGVPRLACVPPAASRDSLALRAPFDAEPVARPALADFAVACVAPDRAPLPPDAARFDVVVSPARFDAVAVAPAPCWRPPDFDAARDADAFRPAAPAPARSDAPPRPVAALVVVERDPPAVPSAFAPRVALADFVVPDFDAPVFFAAAFDAPPWVAPPFEALFFAAPAVFAAPLVFEALPRMPLPPDAAFLDPAPLDDAPFDAVRDDADDFFTAAPRVAVASSPPSAARALFERPACLPIIVPACAAPGAVRPPAVVAMGMLRSNVAPAGARSS